MIQSSNYYTEKEIQEHGEIFVREDKIFGMTFKFFVFKDSKGEYTNLALYKADSYWYREINVYFLDYISAEDLDRRIKKDLKEYMTNPLVQKYIARYTGLVSSSYPV